MQAFLISLFLFLHVMGAIITFGPTFVFPIIASQVQKDPRHGHFGAVLSELVQRRIIIPGAIVQGITGLVLFFLIGVDLTNPDLVAFAGSFGVPAWRVERAAELAPAMRAAVAESGPSLVAISAPVGQPW